MDVQRLRNLTTGKLHTEINLVYEDLELITGEGGIMTHMIPRIMKSVRPWLMEHVTDERFWDGKYDPTHIGTFDIPVPSGKDRDLMFLLYAKQPNPLDGKDVITMIL